MAAFIPSRKDAEVNRVALEKVREDKVRESGDGFDGTWVAHPDLVPHVKEIFDGILGDKPHQKERLREDVKVTAQDLMNFKVQGGKISEAGLRLNINVGLLYIESWLQGAGAAALYNLMEDAATAEISRAQIWQWINNPRARLDDGRDITADLYRSMAPQELESIKEFFGEKLYAARKFDLAAQIMEELSCKAQFADFLTLLAYKHLE